MLDQSFLLPTPTGQSFYTLLSPHPSVLLSHVLKLGICRSTERSARKISLVKILRFLHNNVVKIIFMVNHSLAAAFSSVLLTILKTVIYDSLFTRSVTNPEH